jgi:hypothetical protein
MMGIILCEYCAPVYPTPGRLGARSWPPVQDFWPASGALDDRAQSEALWMASTSDFVENVLSGRQHPDCMAALRVECRLGHENAAPKDGKRSADEEPMGCDEAPARKADQEASQGRHGYLEDR